MASTLVCETVTADRMAALRQARDRATSADLVELRLDGVTDVDVAGALEGRKKPVIVTCRPVREGGRFDGAEEVRLRILADAVRLGAEWVDLEFDADWQRLPRGERTRVVLSHHDFAGVPADLASRAKAMAAAGADVTKISVQATRLSDCVTLRDAVKGCGPVIAIAMGPMGQVTRLCPWLFGSRWTYGGQAAPGQLSVCDLVDTYRIRRTTTATAIYAVTGAPLVHSASPAMHNSAIDAAGLDAVYVPLETSDADDFFDAAEALGVRGASVTAPLKTAVLGRGVRADEMARRIGAVNTLCRRDGRWEGRNFDVAGFLTPLDRRSSRLTGQRAVVLGAGGAARAAVWALKAHGAHVEIAARRPEQAAALARDLHAVAVDWPPRPGWDLLVNTTPVGTWPDVDASPIARDRVRGTVVYDLVYNPLETCLMRWGRDAGAETIGGLEMLVGQACRQFEWWTGMTASLTAIERGAIEFLNRSISGQGR